MKESKQIGIYKNYLREHLSKKRYTHSLNVAASAVELAKSTAEIPIKRIQQDFSMI